MKRSGAGRVALLLWTTVALMVIAGAVLLLTWERAPKLAEAGEKPVAVTLLTLSPRRIPDLLVIPGRVQPVREAVLGVEQEGMIAERFVERGDRVQANDLLLRADSRLIEAALRRAEIEQADATRDLRRLTELRKTGAVSDADYDAAVSREAAAAVALQDGRIRLDQCELRAPFGGIIDERWVEAGEFAARGRDAFRLVDVAAVKVRFAVPERDILFVRPDAAVSFTVSADPGVAHTGRVTYISAAGLPASNAFAVELTATNAEGRLRPGMIVDVRLVRRMIETSAIVPLAAVVPRKGENVVYVEKDGRAARRTVQLDVVQGDEVVLAAGVAEGDRVVVEGQRTLQDGALLGPVATNTAPERSGPAR